MGAHDFVGGVLVAGLVLFLVGAVFWRMAYQQPWPDALVAMAADRRRLTWIHLWMIAGVFATSVGLAGLLVLPTEAGARAVIAMATAGYLLGAVCLIVSLAFRLTVIPWVAERTVADGAPPDGFAALDAWAGYLYAVHMVASYVAFAVLGAGILVGGDLPTWLGWLGVGWGAVFATGLVATRFAGPFNPPFLAHTYTAAVGAVLLLT